MNTANVIKQAICELAPAPNTDGVQDFTLLASIGIVDSLEIIKLSFEIEDRFKITIDTEAVAAWKTVGDVVRDVQNMLDAKTQPSEGVYRERQVITDDTVAAMKNMPAINRIERADVEMFKSLHETQLTKYNTLALYQRIATKSAIYPGKGTPFGLMYAALGLAEAGEVQNKVKKAFRDDGVIDFSANGADMRNGAHVAFQPITSERRAQIIKELGGVLWYIAAVCDEINATMSEVALTNLDELCGRGERDTLRGDGDNR